MTVGRPTQTHGPNSTHRRYNRRCRGGAVVRSLVGQTAVDTRYIRYQRRTQHAHQFASLAGEVKWICSTIRSYSGGAASCSILRANLRHSRLVRLRQPMRSLRQGRMPLSPVRVAAGLHRIAARASAPRPLGGQGVSARSRGAAVNRCGASDSGARDTPPLGVRSRKRPPLPAR